jgi:hypothetical protein
MKKPPTSVEQGFIFKEVGDKLNYAIYHKQDNGKKLLGWIRKYCVDEKDVTK